MAEKTSCFHLAMRGMSFQSIQVLRWCSSRAFWSLRTKSWSSRAYEMNTSAMVATLREGSTHMPHGPAEKQAQRPKEAGWLGTSAEYLEISILLGRIRPLPSLTLTHSLCWGGALCCPTALFGSPATSYT